MKKPLIAPIILTIALAGFTITNAQEKKTDLKLPDGMVALSITNNDEDDWDNFEDQSAANQH